MNERASNCHGVVVAGLQTKDSAIRDLHRHGQDEEILD